MGTSASRSLGGDSPQANQTVANAILDVRIKNLQETVKNQKQTIAELNAKLKIQEIKDDSTLKQQLYEKENELMKLRKLVENQKTKLESYKKQINEMSLIQSATAPRNALQSIPNPVVVDDESTRNLPKIGDHVVSMWSGSKWQYFTATIMSFDPSSLKYTIEWDDHDPTGLVVDYFNLALDKVPPADQIAVGSKVLFNQGQYKASQVTETITRSGGLRWHEGEITRVYTDVSGQTLYDGRHTKGESDGKWVTYKDYSDYFIGYHIDDFRLPPNVFDIMSTQSSANNAPVIPQDIDVFVSYAKINCPSAIKNKEVQDSSLPPSYEQVMIDTMCDPRDIVKRLREMGVKVFFMEDETGKSDFLLQIINAMKSAKVFIACLSDEYASDDRCRMEFQYAKRTLGLPVIPVVVGTGSLQWKLTVVGLLVAGELYIHFKNKRVEDRKMIELVRAVKNHIPNLEVTKIQQPDMGNAVLPVLTNPGQSITGSSVRTGSAEIFFSYCWYNSHSAFRSLQIPNCVGKEWNDPRLLEDRVEKKSGMTTWLDIERLESADGMGMFSQIATALGECKAVVACISTEYAVSDNCRMEIQFALSSLNKPLVAVVVGDGESWRETVVGKVISENNCPIVDMQTVSSEEQFNEKLSDIVNKLSQILSVPLSPTSDETFRAPVPGDHVVSHHQRWAYFTATIESFDNVNLTYTVNWDDGDPTGRVQSYENIALNVVPSENQIGVGSIVLFPQGSYGATEGNNTGGARYHQGKITRIWKDNNNTARYDGEHTKGEEDGKWITWGAYQRQFTGLTLEQLRVSPNAMDALMACKKAFNISQQ